MLSSVVGMVGEVYYEPPVKRDVDDLVDSVVYSYELLNNSYQPPNKVRTLEDRTTRNSKPSDNFYKFIKPCETGPTEATLEFASDLQEDTEVDLNEPTHDVKETTTSVVDMSTGKKSIPS